MKKNLVGIIFLIYSFNSLMAQTGYPAFCTSDDRFTEVEYFAETDIESMLDVTYGTADDWQGNPESLLLDVFYPSSNVDNLTERPFILLIHGGGFISGSKESLTNDCIEFAQRGYVAATMSYRLGWSPFNPNGQTLAMYRAQQDAAAALRYIVNNAAQLGIDVNQIFIGGSSAGGITSLNTAYLDEAEWETVYPNISTLLGPLNTSGNNLTDTYDLKGIYNNWGATLITGMQPEEMIPTISFHGIQDQVVLYGYYSNGVFGGSGIIHETLNANGVCNELTVDSLGGHGIYGSGTIPGDQYRSERVSCFFKSLFCDNCTSDFLTDSIPAMCSTVCTFPSNITVDLGTDPNAVTLSWDPVPGITKYQVRYREALTTTWTNVVVNNATSKELTGLRQNRVYDYRIRSWCENTGTWSDMSVIDKFRTVICLAPLNPNTTQLSNNKVRVEWDTYTYADKYQVFYRLAGTEDPWERKVTYLEGMTSRVLSNLTPGATYEYKVRSFCEVSYGPFTDLAYFTNAATRLNSHQDLELKAAFPNPVSQDLNIVFHLEETGDVIFQMTDILGKNVLFENNNFEKGSNQKVIHMNNFENGYYLLTVIKNGVRRTEKILKR